MRFHLMLVRMAIIKKIRNNKCWTVGEKRIHVPWWWEGNWCNHYGKQLWIFLKKLKIKLPYDPKIKKRNHHHRFKIWLKFSDWCSYKKRRGHRETYIEKATWRQVETGAMIPRGTPGGARNWKKPGIILPLEPSKGAWPCQHLGFEFPVSRTMIKETSQ